eukprot:SAG31_NODE_2465_length_5655_cov_2.338553_6_plen_103_part_00
MELTEVHLCEPKIIISLLVVAPFLGRVNECWEHETDAIEQEMLVQQQQQQHEQSQVECEAKERELGRRRKKAVGSDGLECKDELGHGERVSASRWSCCEGHG